MIEITQSVDAETQTVSWTFAEHAPEHAFEGRMCHAISEQSARDGVGRCLDLLGYEHVVTIQRSTPLYPDRPHDRVQYWARVTP